MTQREAYALLDYINWAIERALATDRVRAARADRALGRAKALFLEEVGYETGGRPVLPPTPR